MPGGPTTLRSRQKNRFDFHPGEEFVGGAWPGSHVQGVTYSRHVVQVTSGFMGMHIGIPSGGNTAIGAAWNGLQIRPLAAGPPAAPAVSSIGVWALVAILLAAGALVFRRTGCFDAPIIKAGSNH